MRSSIAAPGASPDALPDHSRIVRNIILAALVTVVLVSAAALWGGLDGARGAVTRIGAVLFVLGTCVASLAYLVRFARWSLILRKLGHRVPAYPGLRAYLAGLALSCSPGKLGETVRSGLLLGHGVPVSHSVGAFLADRAGDVLGVIALAALGAAAAGSGSGWASVAGGVLLATSLGVAAAFRRHGFETASTDATHPHWPVQVRRLARPVEAWAQVWTPVRVLQYAGAAVAAYGLQALVFAAYVDAVGGGISIGRCVEIFATSTLFGAATMIPGGLGAMEAALVWRLGQEGVAFGPALAAALAIRVSTLWFGTLIGASALATFAGRRVRPDSTPTGDPTP